MRRVIAGAVSLVALVVLPSASARVLRVGSLRGVPGQFGGVQQAVRAARPHDWILVGPGDYKTTGSETPAGAGGKFPAGVLIATPRITLRGMNRNTVLVDGTKPGSPRCSDSPAAQNHGPGAAGLNGIEIWKADSVSVENMTACNFLAGSGGNTGNEFWWNGGADSGTIGGRGYRGSYLNATSTFFDSALGPAPAEASAAAYGIYSSNWDGGTWSHTYASNMNDSGYYIGACAQQCNQVVDHAWAEFSALGYSGSNSGGSLVVKSSQFDNNLDGFDTNSQNGDNPPPQNGACPGNAVSPITHTHSCWVFIGNYVHDNNNPNVPAKGAAAAGPVGTGLSISGGRNDTVMNNTFQNNGAWGTIVVPFPDSGPPCTGGAGGALGPGSCLYDEYGDAVLNNRYINNGFFGNPTNGDFEFFNLQPNEPTNCFAGNQQIGGGGLTSDAARLEKQYPSCDGRKVGANLNPLFLDEVACDSQISFFASQSAPCLPGSRYPRETQINNGLHPLPPAAQTPAMPHPCAGVPANPWCSGAATQIRGCAAAAVMVPLTLAPREKLASVAVRVRGGSIRTTPARRYVEVPLGAPRRRRVAVAVTETVRVGSHRERFSFTRIYRRC